MISGPASAPSDALEIRVSLKNIGTQVVKLREAVLASAVLVLEVENERGEHVPTVPPPVPAAESRDRTIEPSETIELTYQLSIFSPPLPSGRYSVRVRLAGVSGDPFTFEIQSPHELTFQRFSVPKADVSLELPAQEPSAHWDKAWDIGGVVGSSQQLGAGEQNMVSVLARVGPGENALSELESSRQRCSFKPASALTVCGRHAQLVVMSCPEEHIACVMVPAGTPGGNHPAYVPPITTWALQFSTAQFPGSVKIDMPTAFAEAQRNVVERVFASILCE